MLAYRTVDVQMSNMTPVHASYIWLGEMETLLCATLYKKKQIKHN